MNTTDIREIRKSFGLTQSQVSEITGIPLRTLKNWEAFEVNPNNPEAREPSFWAKRYVLKEIENFRVPAFKIRNSNVENYAEICKKFSHDTAGWSGLIEYNFYTTDSGDWSETSDNAHDGVDVKWAFHLTDKEIEMRAAEELFEKLMEELDLAISDKWNSGEFETIFDKFDF